MEEIRQSGFRLGRWLVQPESNEIANGEHHHHLEPKAMAVLCCLYQAQGQVVSRDRLMAEVWQGSIVSDHALNRVIAELRRTLGDSHANPRYIETIPKRGYRLIARTRPLEAPAKLLSATNPPRTGKYRGVLWMLFVPAALLILLAWHFSGSRTLAISSPELIYTSRLPGIESTPSIAPDGRRVAFAWAVDRSNQPDIYITDLTQAPPRQQQITHSPYWDTSPTWSPEGHRLAYIRSSRQRQSCEVRLHVLPSGRDEALAPCSFLYHIGSVRPLDWSADGRWIAYRDRPSPDGNSMTALISPDSGEIRHLPGSSEGTMIQAAWHPDSQRLVITELISINRTRVSLLNLNGELTRLFDGNYVFGLDWLTDDTLIGSEWRNEVYATMHRPSMFVHEVGSGNRRYLDLSDRYPVSHPASAQFAVERWNRAYEIAIVDTDQPQVLKTSLAGHYPNWSSSSQRLVYVAKTNMPQLWTADSEGGDYRIIDLPEDLLPLTAQWHPFEARLLVTAVPRGSSSAILYVMDTDGRVAARYAPAAGDYYHASWSRSGDHLYASRRNADVHTLVRIDVGTGKTVPVADHVLAAYQELDDGLLVQSSQDLKLRRLSPNGTLSEPLLQRNPIFAWDWGLTSDDHIYYVDRLKDRITVRLHQPDSGAEQTLAEVTAKGVVGMGVAYAEAQDRVFLNTATIEESDFAVYRFSDSRFSDSRFSDRQ